MNKFCFILSCILCLATIPVYAEDNFWDKPPHPNGVYGYDQLHVITKGEDWDYEPPAPAKVVGYRFLSEN